MPGLGVERATEAEAERAQGIIGNGIEAMESPFLPQEEEEEEGQHGSISTRLIPAGSAVMSALGLRCVSHETFRLLELVNLARDHPGGRCSLCALAVTLEDLHSSIQLASTQSRRESF